MGKLTFKWFGATGGRGRRGRMFFVLYFKVFVNLKSPLTHTKKRLTKEFVKMV